MEIPAKVSLYCPLIDAKGSPATLVAVHQTGYYQLEISVKGQGHTCLSPTPPCCSPNRSQSATPWRSSADSYASSVASWGVKGSRQEWPGAVRRSAWRERFL